ncbi:hypothetical protein ABT352_38460 [Streptosporangium sp. NPDC000563]|uniref:hypothetical protein n=1 Tax=Streptosporangium sp. NPDC000563 TaxID=3154366 RepID=UPI0033292D19
MSPMLAGILVVLMLIVCVCFEVCMVPHAREENAISDHERDDDRPGRYDTVEGEPSLS